MAARKHKTMKQAQYACQRLRDDPRNKENLKRAAKIEAQWRGDPDYESDHMWLLRKQAG